MRGLLSRAWRWWTRPWLRRTALGLAAFLAAFVAFDGASTPSEHADPRPNVILISVDTLRADHLESYGYSRKTSPNLLAFGKSGVVFEQAYSSATWTIPAHASMLNGQGCIGDHRKLIQEGQSYY